MSERLGYWLDYEHPYLTMSAPYIESVWWSLKQLSDEGPAREGPLRPPVLPAVRDPALLPRGRPGVQGDDGPVGHGPAPPPGTAEGPARWILVWTTTPWTLPANLLVAAQGEPRLRRRPRRRRQRGDPRRGRAAAVLPAGRGDRPCATKGASSPASSTTRRSRSTGAVPGRYRVVLDDMVSDAEGTGFVHIAPSFGVEDQRVGAREGVGVFDPLDGRGVFTNAVPLVAGKSFKARRPDPDEGPRRARPPRRERRRSATPTRSAGGAATR